MVGAVVGAVSVGGVLLYNNREAVGDALDKGMTSLGEAEILKAESEMAFWNDPCGAFASVFGGDDSGNPNVGKDLTDEEKNELGGGSGAPGDQRVKMNGIRYSLQAHLRGKLKIHMVLLKMPPISKRI